MKVGAECKIKDLIAYGFEVRCFINGKIRPRYELNPYGKATRFVYLIEKQKRSKMYCETVKISEIYDKIDLVFDREMRIIAKRKEKGHKLKFVRPENTTER